MAEIPFTIVEDLSKTIEGTIYRWSSVGQNDTFQELPINEGNNELTFVVFGNAGGASVTLQGSLGRTQNIDAKDPSGNAIATVTPNEIFAIGPAMTSFTPVRNGGSGSTDLTCEMYVVKKTRFGL